MDGAERVLLSAETQENGRVAHPGGSSMEVDPDEAWRQNRPLKIPRGPVLFDFAWLPKPELLPPRGSAPAAEPPPGSAASSTAGGQANGAVAGAKRKAPEPVNGQS